MLRPRARTALFSLITLYFSALTLVPASALVPVEPAPPAEQLLDRSPEAITRALSRGAGDLGTADRLRADRALAAFTGRMGGRWSVQAWNPVTLTPRLVTGSGVPTGVVVLDASTAERVARGFVDAGATLRPMRADQLETRTVVRGLGKWSVHFTQRLHDWPVIGSRFTVAMTETGRIAAFGGDLWPDLRVASRPTLSRDEAIVAARRTLAARGAAPRTLGPRDRIAIQQMGVLPVSATEGRVIYRIDAFFHAPLGAWLIDVDASSGRVLQIQHVLRTDDFVGTASADTEDPSYCFPAQDLPAQLLEVTVVGVGADTTSADGSFTIPFAGSEAESLRAEMAGAYFNVDNNQGDDALFEGEIVPGVPFDLYWDDTNSRIDERDVFYHGNLAHEFIKGLDPDWTDLDWQMTANVNIPQACNAYWDGSSINFFHATANCANTGRLGDVIHHEYGHGITDYMYGPNDPPSDMHEANSDVIGNYLTNDSQMGRGFYLDCSTGIRNSDNSMTYPDSLTGQGHHDGQILAGFHWDARQNLMATLGEEAGHQRASEIWHFARKLGLPLTQPEQVLWSFIADDDDGNLDSGTPNWDDLCPAAERHGFACPERFTDVVIHHTPFPYVAAPSGEPIAIEAQIYSLTSTVNPDSVLVYYRPAGAPDFAAVLMQPTGSDDIFVGEVPNQEVGTLLEYYVFAADMAHHSLTDPRDAPAEVHEAEVVTVYEPFESEGGWMVGAPGDDATQGIWERVDPTGAIVGPEVVQPEDDATPEPGHICWITGQFDGGYPWYSDADGQTTLLSPVYDLTGADQVTVLFQRWFQTFGSQDGMMDVDAANNGGPWQTIHHAEGYEPETDWTEVEVDLTTLFPDIGQVQFRVVMYGLPNPSIDEGGLDDFTVIALEGLAGAQDPEPRHGPALSLSAYSPLGGSVAIRFALPSSGPADLRVHDLNGRTVRRLAQGPLNAGSHEITWDGCDTSGEPLSTGVYFLRLHTAHGERSRRVLLAR